MSTPPISPMNRRPRLLFGKGASKVVPTQPLNTPPEAEDINTPTLPMPGFGNPTLPLIPEANAYRSGSGDAAAVAEHQPVVGWVVILSGPGRARSFEISYGRNSIGRAHDNDVVLDFGDDTISGHAHAYLAYDARSHKAYLSDGNSRNLVYLNGTPVLGTVEIPSGAIIHLGHTKLMYVAFCSERLDWKLIPETDS